MNWLQTCLFGPYFSSFSNNSYGYYSKMSQNLFSSSHIFASAQIVRQAARLTKTVRSSTNVWMGASPLIGSCAMLSADFLQFYATKTEQDR
jgi:hypothetical protein